MPTTRSRYIADFVIAGNNIANGSITFSDLGTVYSDNITEAVNLFYTNARARTAITITGAGSYDNTTGVINITGGVTSVNGQTGAVVLSSSNISEGSNLYYTNARARTAILVTGSGSYDNTTGIINIIGGNISSGVGIVYDSATGNVSFREYLFPAGDFGNLTASFDAFGVSLTPNIDLMNPPGSIELQDLGALAS